MTLFNEIYEVTLTNDIIMTLNAKPFCRIIIKKWQYVYWAACTNQRNIARYRIIV